MGEYDALLLLFRHARSAPAAKLAKVRRNFSPLAKPIKFRLAIVSKVITTRQFLCWLSLRPMNQYTKHFLISGGAVFVLTQILGNYSVYSYLFVGFWIGFFAGVAFKNRYKNLLKDE